MAVGLLLFMKQELVLVAGVHFLSVISAQFRIHFRNANLTQFLQSVLGLLIQ